MTKQRSLYEKNYISRILLLGALISFVESQGSPTSSPATEFISKPTNRTVLEGSPVVLRCKIRDLVHTCQWFYLEPGLSFYDDETSPVLVKEFRPSGDRDCSIRFNKVIPVQNGQWLCKGLQIHQRKYIVSEPVFLRVIAEKDDKPKSTTEAITESLHIFKESDEGRVINTEIGLFSTLDCNSNKPLRSCSWISPHGQRISIEETSSRMMRYEIKHRLAEGKCPMHIKNVTQHDEGNWHCVVTAAVEAGERIGPFVHLHLSHFGVHHTGSQNSVLNNETSSYNDSSFKAILIGVSILLLIIVVVLVIVICKRASSLLCKRSDQKTEEPTVTHQTDNSLKPAHKMEQSFSPSFIPTIGLGRHHIQQQQSVPNHYTRYLDMTGGASINREAFMMVPPGTRAPVPIPNMNPVPTDRMSSFNEMNSLNDIQRRMKTYDNNCFQADPCYIHQGPLYNGSHLYEEIDERHGHHNSQLVEDGEGYMLPRSSNVTHPELPCSQLQQNPAMPPECGYIPQEGQRWIKNETQQSDVTSGIISYNVPREPATPVRNDYLQEKNHIMSQLSNCTPVLV